MTRAFWILLIMIVIPVTALALEVPGNSTDTQPFASQARMLCPTATASGITLRADNQDIELNPGPGTNIQCTNYRDSGTGAWVMASGALVYASPCPSTYPYMVKVKENWNGVVSLAMYSKYYVVCCTTPQPMMSNTANWTNTEESPMVNT